MIFQPTVPGLNQVVNWDCWYRNELFILSHYNLLIQHLINLLNIAQGQLGIAIAILERHKEQLRDDDLPRAPSKSVSKQ